jgi:hypothetical protein
MGSKTKIYIVLEFATGGELFDTIVSDMHIARSSLCSFCYTHHSLTVSVPSKFFDVSPTDFH